MEHIIGEAKLSAGAIYSYFQSKDQIIETLADERHDREKELIRQALTDGDWNKSLNLLFGYFYESLTDLNELRQVAKSEYFWLMTFNDLSWAAVLTWHLNLNQRIMAAGPISGDLDRLKQVSGIRSSMQ